MTTGTIATCTITIMAGTMVDGATTGAAVGTRRSCLGPRPGEWRPRCPRGATTTATTTAYSNPYYVASATPAYDYSQPIVINTYNTPTADASADASPEQTTTATQESPQEAEAYKAFDAAREAFTKGDYSRALELDEQAIRSDLE